MDAVKGNPSTHGLCAYFPYGEYFMTKREVINANDLKVDVANIKPGSPAATKLAHLQRLESDLPDPCDFGDEYSCTYGFKGEASRPIMAQTEKVTPIAQRLA